LVIIFGVWLENRDVQGCNEIAVQSVHIPMYSSLNSPLKKPWIRLWWIFIATRGHK